MTAEAVDGFVEQGLRKEHKHKDKDQVVTTLLEDRSAQCNLPKMPRWHPPKGLW